MKKVKILFFIGSLNSGGKERRLVELMTYLASNEVADMEIAFTTESIDFPAFYDLDIPYHVLPKKWKHHDPFVVLQFFKLYKKVKPDIIHTWGQMQSFYTLPTAIISKTPLVNSQITSAPPHLKRYNLSGLIDQVNFFFSRKVLANSSAGLEAFRPPKDKSQLIYNGMNMNRFENLPPPLEIKQKYQIKTPYAVVMVATISNKKDYRLFFEAAKVILQFRQDISFIGVGNYNFDDPDYLYVKEITEKSPNLLFSGPINDVEALVQACDIGVLFSPYGEGISNTILEYMALSKPVIANNLGGNKELIQNRVNGFLLDYPTKEEVAHHIIELIDTPPRREEMGRANRKKIEENFTIDIMGKAFVHVYQEILRKKIPIKTKLIKNENIICL